MGDKLANLFSVVQIGPDTCVFASAKETILAIINAIPLEARDSHLGRVALETLGRCVHVDHVSLEGCMIAAGDIHSGGAEGKTTDAR